MESVLRFRFRTKSETNQIVLVSDSEVGIRNCAYYWSFGAYIAYYVNHPHYTPVSDLQMKIGFAIKAFRISEPPPLTTIFASLCGGNHHQPLNLTSEHFDLMIDSGAPFGHGFASEARYLTDRQILRRLIGGFTSGGWCLGSSLLGKDPSRVYRKPSVLRLTLSSKRLEKLLSEFQA